jgi:drug/metabolite transporter (DMT)-like permease
MSATSITKSNLTRGYPLALASAVFLSMTGILIRYLTQTYQMPTLVLACLRDLLVALTLLPVLIVLRPALIRVNREHLRYLVFYGLLQAIFNAMWTLSVSLNGAAVATVLAYSSAGFTALLGWWLLKEDLGWAKILAVSLSLGGCVLVSGALDPAAWRANLLGILTGILSGLFFAIYTLMGRSAAKRGLNPWTTLFYTFGFAAVYLLVLNLLPGRFLPGMAARPADLLWLGKSLAGWGALFLLAAGPTLAGFGLYNMSLTYLPSSVVNLIAIMEPVFTAVIAYFLLGERLMAVQIAGSLLIIAAVVFLRVYEGWSVRQQPAGAYQGG